MNILAILFDGSLRQQVERAFQRELPEVSFGVIEANDLNSRALSELSPDMVIIEKGLSNTETTNLIREIRSVSKAPIVLMATEKDAFYIGPAVSDKYESIFETSRKTRLPAWLKRFYSESKSKTAINNHN